jgi:DegV family protein with EDD domain
MIHLAKPVILTADSTCDLSPELIEKYQVHILPLSVLLGEQNYHDGVDLVPDEIYRVYREQKILPKTAAVNTAEYLDFFTPFLEQGCEVVHISLSSALSACYNNCRLAALQQEGIYPIDSRNLSTGSGLLVIAAAERIAAGLPAEQVAAEVGALVEKVEASFIIDSLEFLHKGGRCSALAMMGANLLQLKPCIEVDPAVGGMGVGKKYRGAFDKVLVQYVKERLSGRTDLCTDRIFITHAGVSEDRIAAVRAEVEGLGLFDEILVTRAGCTVSSHCGQNTLGVLFLKK